MAIEKLEISGDIGWSVTPRDITDKLRAAAGKDLEVTIASPGGSVFDGIEIFNAFRDYKREFPGCQMMLTVRGLAASMASYLSVNPAFDLVVAEDNAVFMIHNAWGGAVGDYRDMKKTGEILEGVTDLLGQAYAKRTGRSMKKIREDMDAESWYFGNEILEAGFVDEIVKAPEPKEKQAAVTEAKVNFSALSEKLMKAHVDYNKIAASINSQIETHPAADAGQNITEVITMTLDELLSQNPAAKIEYDSRLKAAESAGTEKGKAAMLAISEKAAKFAASKEYPAQVHAVALDVMQGKKSVEALEVLVANADMLKEMIKSQEAKLEQKGDTKGEQVVVPSADGKIETNSDLDAEIARSRAALGLEVK